MPVCGPKCYPRHVPTSAWEKVLLTVGSGIAALRNPYRDDMVAVVSETTSRGALEQLRWTMLADPVGRRILRERPQVTPTTVPLDAAYPAGSLGERYAEYMRAHGFDSASRAPVRYVDDAELAYILTRYRQSHDFFHVLTGLPATVHGEWALKAFEACHLALPMPALATLFGIPRFAPPRPASVLAWASHARDVPCLLNVYFEHRLHEQVDELRRELGVKPAPRFV